MKFDPQTGQPIPETNDTKPAFDPQTGAPLNNTAAPAANQAPKKKKPAMIIGIAACVAVVLIAVIAVANLFSSPNTKVMKALLNSFKAEQIVDSSVFINNPNNRNTSIEVSGEAEGSKFDANINLAKGKKESSLSGKVEFDGAAFDMNFYMNDSIVAADIPALMSEPVYYDYTEKDKDGDLLDQLDVDADFDDLDTFLATVNNADGLVKDLQKASGKAFGELKFKKDKKTKKLEVNGKKVKCTGYTATIDGDTVEAILKDYQKALEKYDDIIAAIEEMSGSDVEDLIDSATESIDEDDKIKLTVYIKGKQAAGIVLSGTGSNDAVEIYLKGGKYAAQNLEVKVMGEKVVEIEGETKKSEITQKTTYYDYGDVASTMTVKYDTKSGEISYEMDYPDEDMNIKYSGTVETTKNSIKMELDDFELSGDSFDELGLKNLKVSVEMKKGAEIEEIEIDDDALNLGTADSDDFEELSEEISEKVFSLMSF